MRTRFLQFAFLLFVSLIFQGCMSTLFIPVLQPAQVTLPSNYEKFAVVHRHTASKDNNVRNVIEGILTGEGLEADKDAGLSCLGGLKESLVRTPRYTVVEPAGLDLRGTGTGNFPNPLEWSLVEKICNDNGADALIVLEVFDSNSGIVFSTSERKVKNKDGVETTVIDHHARLRMNVTSGWRIYDPVRKILADEFRGDHFLEFVGTGPNQLAATAAVINRREALRRTGFHAGSQYGYRIAPQWITVVREYYTKGSPNLRTAGRFAKVNNWNEAEEIWKRLSNSPVRRTARRSTYNMAIAREVQGDLEGAREWARKSFTHYNVRKGRRYAAVIQGRINDRNRLEMQMK
jgi:hypothetical protein